VSTPVTAQSTVAAADGAAPLMVTVNATVLTSSSTCTPFVSSLSASVTLVATPMLNTGAAVTVTATAAAVVTLP